MVVIIVIIIVCVLCVGTVSCLVVIGVGIVCRYMCNNCNCNRSSDSCNCTRCMTRCKRNSSRTSVYNTCRVNTTCNCC